MRSKQFLTHLITEICSFRIKNSRKLSRSDVIEKLKFVPQICIHKKSKNCIKFSKD